MNIVLLSGGSGKRLWPLSNDIRSKQFIKLFKYGDSYESMVQRVYRQLKEVDSKSKITIATSKSQVSIINNQLGDNVSISVEPCRRDTFPAIALSAAFLYYEKNVDLNESIVVCPVDPYVEFSYFECIKEISDHVQKQKSNITLIGIEPTNASTKFGYIIPENNEKISKVVGFKEKPSEVLAKKYIQKGALWNGGVFAFKLGYIIDKAHELINFIDYQDLYNKYEFLEKISFDYAVLESEKYIEVIRYKGIWEDLGTWNTFVSAMEDSIIGNAIIDDFSINTNIVNELDIPILCLGMKDCIISASPDGILISDKDLSSEIKGYVERINRPTMYAEKSWGQYKVIDAQDNSLTIKINLKKGHEMNYHSHQFRNEVWTILSGEAKAIINDREYNLQAGDTMQIPQGTKHKLYAKTDLQVIEIQSGKDISKSDKIKY